MTNKLPLLTETDIRARCSEASFERGRSYYLLDIFSIYPDLVDDLDVVTGANDENLEAKVTDIIGDMQPWGRLTEDEVEAHLRLIARRADRLAKEGRADLARRIYFALIRGCVNLCREYSSYDFFSANIPYDFAVA